MVRGLKFLIKEEGLYYVAKTSAEQLCDFRAADLHLCFRICIKQVFFPCYVIVVLQVITCRSVRICDDIFYMYHRKHVMSNVACDWSMYQFYIAEEANVLCKMFWCVKVGRTLEWGITIFKIFICGGISFEPREKTGFLHMRKQRRRSVVR